MKKVLLFIAIALSLFSCKREHSVSTAPAGKKYPVMFNITNFTTHQGNFAIRHGANHLADTVGASATGFDLLYYEVYDSFGAEVHNFVLVQDSTMVGFGTVTDSLGAGNYQIAFIGGKKGLQIAGAARIANATFNYGGPEWYDTFWNTMTLTVGTSGISQNVTLKRVVGKLELDITDAIPANADSLIFNVNPEAARLRSDSGSPDGPPSGTVTYAEKIPAGAIGTSNFTMDRLIANTAVPFTVTITCKNTSNAVIGSATVNNVSVQANMKTVLSGNLFGGTPPANSQTFTVKVDTAWNSTTNNVGF